MDIQGKRTFAVWGRSLTLSYRSRHEKIDVLQNLNIKVQRGHIYGLLGPSGCGKTTLLKCILGQLYYNSGDMFVLGNRPGAPGHGIPGSLVGYMPQEIGLYNLLTIGETLRYFGRIHGMETVYLNRRIEFLLNLLSLPEEHRIVDTLSIGQKRRVSFSVALLHKPDLIILDEPTVGVDPVLRERIWEHLINICNSQLETTVIITTHYIEEARQADMVGLMRNGKLLAEERPQKLMNLYRSTCLEAVFLKLCNQDQRTEEAFNCNFSKTISKRSTKKRNTSHSKRGFNWKKRQTTANNGTDELDESIVYGTTINTTEKDSLITYNSDKNNQCRKSMCRNLYAQSAKNLTQMKKNIGLLLFMVVFPSIQIILFCTCIGKKPYDLTVSIVNEEGSAYSKKFLQFLDPSTLHNVRYTSFDAAMQSVQDGTSYGVISIGQNFSVSLFRRFMNAANASKSVIEQSQIKLHLDMTNPQIALTIYHSVMESFENFCTSVLKSFYLNPSLAQFPVVLADPIYGAPNFSKLTDVIASGMMLSITFSMATGSTILALVMERNEGLVARTIVAGVTAFEIMLAHIMTQLIIVVLQVALVIGFTLFAFEIPREGPLIWVIILALGMGFCGMTLGGVFSSLCDSERSALQLALGSVYPMLLLGGILWPLEAIPDGLKFISMCLPTTSGSQAMRAILIKGWDITYMEVWRGYLITFGWAFGLLALTAIILRIRHF